MLRRLLTPLRIAFAIGMVLSVARFQGCLYLHLTDVRAMDYRLLQRGIVDPGPEAMVVAVDDASIEEIGRWPWPRAIVGKLVAGILAGEPAVLGFDIVFSEPTKFEEREGLSARPSGVDAQVWATVQRTLARQDELLAEALGSSGRVVLGYFYEFKGDETPATNVTTYNLVRGALNENTSNRVPRGVRAKQNLPEFFKEAFGQGYFDVLPDAGDGSIRRVPLVIRSGDDMAMPLSLSMLKAANPNWTFSIRFADFGVESVQVGKIVVPVAEDGQMLINYRGPGRTFRHISAKDVLSGKVRSDTFRDKMIVLGVTATAVQDIRVTPFDAVFPGVEIHANVIDNILRGDFISQPRFLVLGDVFAIMTLALAVGIAMLYFRGVWAAVATVFILASYMVGTQWLFVSRGLPLTLIYALLAISLTYVSVAVQHYLTEEREKKKVRKVLELYLSPSMAEFVSRHPDQLKLGGEKRELTVFFSDIRGFTTISEGLQPEELVELLNVYLGSMTDIIFQHEGMLDKYIGDAVMAVWGAPLPQPDHALHACQATLEMVSRLRELNESWKPRGWPLMEIGIGLNSGPMVFGNMGSEQHLSLTVMGDNVNLGSRLEGLNKMYGTTVLASESTVDAVGDAVVTRELDLVRVKGKLLPVRIYEVLGLSSEREKSTALIERSERGLAAYRERRWEEAHGIFTAIAAEYHGDGPSKLYMLRCEQMMKTPPGPDWDGVTIMETK
jgi:adenylate cyclase